MIALSIIITLLVLVAAAYTDIKKREVPDWLSYSFIAVAIAAASAKSLIESSFSPLISSLSGLAIFFILANIFYYGKLFAGGDAKLLMGIGASLGIDISFLSNVLISGGVYGVLYSFGLASFNARAFGKELKKIKMPILPFALLALIAIIAAILIAPVFYFAAAVSIISPLLYVFVTSVERAALIKIVHPSKLTEGDWLAEDVKISKRTIKANFEGLSKKEILFLMKHKKPVKVKYGLPFVPVFLIAFLAELLIGNLFLLILGI